MRLLRLHVSLLAVVAATACGPGGGAAQEPPPVDPAVVLDPDTRARLLDDLAWLADDARRGRAMGSPEAALVRDWLVARFTEIGLEPTVRPFDPGNGQEAANVVAVLHGTVEPDRYVVVTAHFDHLGERGGTVYNGADDNASGTAALLAAGTWFAAHPPRNSLVFVALDGEEAGLLGARAFVEDPPVDRSAIALNVNMDMVGRSDRGELYVAGTRHHPALLPPLEAVAAAAPVQLRFGHDGPGGGADDWTFQSDHGAFHAAGIPFLYFGVEDHEDYHRPTDDLERIRPAFFIGATETVIAATAAVDRYLADGPGEDGP